MCVVSMVGDYFTETVPRKYGWIQPLVQSTPFMQEPIIIHTGPTREEFDALKREVLEMKELLKRAKKYDEDNGEKDCEMESKVAVLRKVAELVGVDLSEIFPK